MISTDVEKPGAMNKSHTEKIESPRKSPLELHTSFKRLKNTIL
jgi:hypothetical protein